MDLIERATEFEHRKHKFITTSDRIIASREVKGLILEINDIYKETKEQDLMEIMKRLTVIKQKIEKRRSFTYRIGYRCELPHFKNRVPGTHDSTFKFPDKMLNKDFKTSSTCEYL